VLFIILAFANYSHASKPKKLTESITWELKDDGTLIISGKGDMPDYGDLKQRNSYSKNCPWAKGKRREAVKSVIIENGITHIGNHAFRDCDITEITIPNSVISIGNYAFTDCNLTTLNIPNSVKSIGDYAFYDNDLTTLNIPNSVKSIGDRTFCGNKITTLTIPDSVTSIGDGVFGSNKITTLKIANSVTNIGGSAFYNNGITTLTIPNSVTYIGSKAFLLNDIITLTIPDSVKSIGDEAFAPNWGKVSSARIIHLPSWVTKNDCKRIGISEESYEEYRPSIEWLLKKSKELYDNNNYEEALKYILRAINNEATSAPTAVCYNQAGVYYFALGRYKEALNMLLKAAYLRATAIKVVDIKTANFKETDLKATDIKVANDTSLGLYAHNIGDCYRMLNDNKRAREWYMVGSGYGYALALEKLHKYYDVTASASVDKIWVANTDGNTIFHLNNLRVNYAYNEKATLILHIYDENKRQLTDKNNKYYSPDGYVQFNYEIASAPYIYTIWEDFTITVPTSEIHIDRTKKSRTPYCKLIVKDKDGKIVYTSPYFQFTLDKIETAAPAPTTTSVKKRSTTETAKTQTQTQTQTQTKTQTQTQQAYTPEYGYRDMWVTCTSCAGTGICPSCHGVGHVHGTYVQVCGFCGGTKACPFCGGRGGHYEKVQYQIR